jgi:DNA-binding SARP family transcriptional activator
LRLIADIADAATGSSAASQCTIGLLGGFELRRDGVIVSLAPTLQRVVAFLALQRRPVTRVYVAGTLWTDSDERHAHASLRSALWRVQHSGCHLVTATPTHLALAPAVDVDVRSVSRLICRLREGHAPPSRGEIDDLRDMAELLPDWYDEWLEVERERVRQLTLHSLEAVCRQLTRARRFSEAIDVGLSAVAAERLRESSHRALIEVHLAEGNLSEALRHYDSYRTLVATRLGARPSPEFRALLADAFRGQPTEHSRIYQ